MHNQAKHVEKLTQFIMDSRMSDTF